MAKGNQNTGEFGGRNTVPPKDSPTLSDMGLNKNQSSKYQQIFDVPEDEFIDELAKLDRTSKTTISSSRILNERRKTPKPSKRFWTCTWLAARSRQLLMLLEL